ncbi:MAG TPA: hypothetical protein VEH55_03060 [Gaiellaceae bacterium]|jgi:hypothetical protein|nr:hypothetical protein [Gaiellaceae bacterium]
MIATTPPVPICSSIGFGASGLACAGAPVEKPFSCSAGKIVTLTVSNMLVCVALRPVRLGAVAHR